MKNASKVTIGIIASLLSTTVTYAAPIKGASEVTSSDRDYSGSREVRTPEREVRTPEREVRTPDREVRTPEREVHAKEHEVREHKEVRNPSSTSEVSKAPSGTEILRKTIDINTGAEITTAGADSSKHDIPILLRVTGVSIN